MDFDIVYKERPSNLCLGGKKCVCKCGVKRVKDKFVDKVSKKSSKIIRRATNKRNRRQRANYLKEISDRLGASSSSYGNIQEALAKLKSENINDVKKIIAEEVNKLNKADLKAKIDKDVQTLEEESYKKQKPEGKAPEDSTSLLTVLKKLEVDVQNKNPNAVINYVEKGYTPEEIEIIKKIINVGGKGGNQVKTIRNAIAKQNEELNLQEYVEAAREEAEEIEESKEGPIIDFEQEEQQEKEQEIMGSGKEMTSNEEINDIMNDIDLPLWVGCYGLKEGVSEIRDQEDAFAMIINTTNDVGHWIAVLVKDGIDMEVYDPFGTESNWKDSWDDIILALKDFGDQFDWKLKLKLNLNNVQPEDSEACGYYCMEFLINRIMFNVPFKIASGAWEDSERDMKKLRKKFQRFGYI